MTYQPWNWHTSPAVGAALIALIIAVVVQPIISWWSARRQRLTDAAARKEERDEERIERDKERKHERALALNEHRITNAMALGDSVQAALSLVSDRQVHPRMFGPTSGDPELDWMVALEDSWDSLDVAGRMLDRISLLFGSESATAITAREAVDAAWSARKAAGLVKFTIGQRETVQRPGNSEPAVIEQRKKSQKVIDDADTALSAAVLEASTKLGEYHAAVLDHLA
jgi:hypothetical protein